MATPHVIASSSPHPSQSTTSNGIVGVHYRVGKKIGEGSFGVVFEGELLFVLSVLSYKSSVVFYALFQLRAGYISSSFG